MSIKYVRMEGNEQSSVCSGDADKTVIEGYNGNALAHQGYDDKHVPL